MDAKARQKAAMANRKKFTISIENFTRRARRIAVNVLPIKVGQRVELVSMGISPVDHCEVVVIRGRNGQRCFAALGTLSTGLGIVGAIGENVDICQWCGVHVYVKDNGTCVKLAGLAGVSVPIKYAAVIFSAAVDEDIVALEFRRTFFAFAIMLLPPPLDTKILWKDDRKPILATHGMYVPWKEKKKRKLRFIGKS
jgi:hypothetical protein